MPGNDRDFDSCQGKVREVSGKNIFREKWPKTVYG